MKDALIKITQVVLIGLGVTIYTLPSSPWWMDIIGLVMFMLGLDWRYDWRKR